MRIHLWGTDFRRGTSEMRAKLYFAPEERASRIRQWMELGFSDLIYLPTCNRVEFYTTAKDPFTDTRKLWIRALESVGMSEADYFKGYQLEGKSALRHLLRVACSLESLVVGEPQILGQLKEALQWSKGNDITVDRSLERSFQFAFEVAKRVRTDTSLGEKTVSVATLGLKHLEGMENEYPLQKAILVGRSPMNLSVLQWIKKNRPHCQVTWVNRTIENLKSYPEAEGTKLMALEEFLRNPPEFSHLFTATSSPDILFTRDFFQRACFCHALAFDFAEPPDIETMDESAPIKIIRIEDLQVEAAENTQLRAKAVEEADGIIEQALKDYCLQQKQAPLLRDFNEVEPTVLSELEFALASAEEEFPKEIQEKLKRWAEKLVKKNLHLSREQLRLILQKVSDPQNVVVEAL